MWSIAFDKQAARKLGHIPEPDKSRITESVKALENGIEGNNNVRRLQGRPEYRLRVGGWRVLFRVYSDVHIINITDIGSRGDIYK